MKKLLVLLLLFVSIGMQAQSYVFTINKTQVMKEPNMTSKAVYLIEPKTRIQLVSKLDDTWSQVRVPGLTGYVQNSSLSGFNTNLTTLEGLPYDTTSGKIMLTQVIPAEGVSKDELYTRAREWYALTFKDADEVLQMEDKEAGKLIGKGYSKSSKDPFALVGYTLSVSVKDGRYKFDLTDMHYKTSGTYGSINTPIETFFSEGIKKRAHQDRYEATIESTYGLLQSLNAAMTKKATAKDDW